MIIALVIYDSRLGKKNVNNDSMFESFASHSQQYISTFLAENSIILKTGAEHNLFACKNEQIKCIGCYIFLCVFLEIKFLCFFFWYSARSELRDLRFAGAFYALVSLPLPSTFPSFTPLVSSLAPLPHAHPIKYTLLGFFSVRVQLG